LVTKNQEVWKIALKFAQARLSPPGVAQIAATAAVDTPQEYCDKVNAEDTVRRNVLVQGLNAIEGEFCPNPGGAFYVVAKLSIDDADKFCQWMLEEFSHNNNTEMMASATGFYSTEGAGKNEVRLAYVLNVEDLKESLECLALGLKNYPGKTF